MRRHIAQLVVLATAVLTLGSCLKDNDDTNYTYYSDTAITAFSLGTVNRYLTVKASDGVTDSTVSSAVTGSSYKFVIDQANAQIYNPDSLPYGCDVEAVLATISSKNSGYIYLKSLTSDTLTYYSSSDSIDFSSPRTIRILAQDTQNYRDYTVTVNVHHELEGEFRWSQMANVPADLSAATALNTVARGDSLFVLAAIDGITTLWLYDGSAWTSPTPNINTPLAADACHSALVWNGWLYMVSDGRVLRTQDGTTWELLATGTALTQLAAASSTTLYALTADGLVASTDGATWTAETLDSDASLLPATVAGYSCQAVKTNSQMERVTFVGTQTGSTYAVAWSKLVDFSSTPMTTRWSFVDVSGDNRFALSAMSDLQVLPYDDGLLAFGRNGSALSTLYRSQDGGITWHENTDYSLPAATIGTLPFAATVDGSNHIWLVCANGQLWRGRLNELGWK